MTTAQIRWGAAAAATAVVLMLVGCSTPTTVTPSPAVPVYPTVVTVGDSIMKDNDLVPETVSQLAQLRAALPDAQIIGLSTIWGDTAVPAQLADIDTQVRTAVERVGGHFLELGQPLAGHPEWMQSDDVHPTAAGQLALYSAVQAAFDLAH